MSDYKDYTIEINFKSSIGTVLQSDTVFGHICWAIRFLKWKDKDSKLTNFLSLFDKEDTSPPLLISNGFPKDYLPKPIIPPVTQNELDEILGKEDRIKKSFKIKTIKKTEFITKEMFKDLQQDEITPVRLFKEMDLKENFDKINDLKIKNQNMIVQHNTIDRIKGSVRDGGLYSQEETFFDEGNGVFEIYLKTNYFSRYELEKIFKFISASGYGRDKSTGKGYFEFNIIDGINIPESKNPNAFMTLSSYIPKENDPTEGYYNIIHKFGKLGGIYAKGTIEIGNNPFKVPLIMFSAGSVFRDEDYKPDKIYGSLIKDVHQNKDIRHYAYAFPIGVNINIKE
ncbi:MAG: type III-A CRISPR-associated RAMP protein Csm4 [Candidatus Firestonebacteria bacterium]|nr:type III-A CRISPR-associated RAMP protein Csm4 [Candidatus Firestonebacteria bacterium]